VSELSVVVKLCTTCDKPIKIIDTRIGRPSREKRGTQTFSAKKSDEGACYVNRWFCNDCLKIMARIKYFKDKENKVI